MNGIDVLAAESFAPLLLSNDTFGFPQKCYYRAARDELPADPCLVHRCYGAGRAR